MMYATAALWIFAAWAAHKMRLWMAGAWADQATLAKVACRLDASVEPVKVRAPTGYACEHMSISIGGFAMPHDVHCWNGCDMRPVWNVWA